MNDTFIETDESPIHPALDPEPELTTTGWVSRTTYLASVRQLTAVNRCVSGHLRTVGAVCLVSVVLNLVLVFAWVVM